MKTDTERARKLAKKLWSDWDMFNEQSKAWRLDYILAEMQAVRERTIEECEAAFRNRPFSARPLNGLDVILETLGALKERQNADDE
jgi:hypothetical protein